VNHSAIKLTSAPLEFLQSKPPQQKLFSGAGNVDWLQSSQEANHRSESPPFAVNSKSATKQSQSGRADQSNQQNYSFFGEGRGRVA